MARFFAGVLATLLLMTGAFLIWQGKAEGPTLPAAPAPGPVMRLEAQSLPAPPEASPKSREEKRFARADKDDDGRIARAELLEPRRKAYAKLDKNGDGRLAFEEWAVRTVDKFSGADQDRDGILTPVEYATTAPKPAKKKRCAC